MKLKFNKKNCVVTVISVIFVLVMSISVFATDTYNQYILYGGGYAHRNATFNNHTSYTAALTDAANNWYYSNTPVYMDGTGGTTINSNLYDCIEPNESYAGIYYPQQREWGIGRAHAFAIYLNKSKLTYTSSMSEISSIIAHEFGHAFCLDDNPSNFDPYKDLSIMNYGCYKGNIYKPTVNDEAGVNAATFVPE